MLLVVCGGLVLMMMVAVTQGLMLGIGFVGEGRH
jgi:hypothetical protein